MTKLPEALRKKLEANLEYYRYDDKAYSSYEDGFTECYELLAPLIKDARDCAEFYDDDSITYYREKAKSLRDKLREAGLE